MRLQPCNHLLKGYFLFVLDLLILVLASDSESVRNPRINLDLVLDMFSLEVDFSGFSNLVGK